MIKQLLQLHQSNQLHVDRGVLKEPMIARMDPFAFEIALICMLANKQVLPITLPAVPESPQSIADDPHSLI